ncbi:MULTISPECIES: acyltransferase family protein [Pseudomonas]|uniref:Acyltransferase n=1 Tax=Pseudomonas viciae TaxID=2505979 RepID=A0ABY8PJC3_9PSED|nr:acyltransferase [Pseudomonas viciae]WGO95293.1 acyltransferase [Pseudomonas viciae]
MIKSLTIGQSTMLNLIRALAAFSVLVGHTLVGVVPVSWFGKVVPFQSLAVVVFFWLSGFLIAYQCLNKVKYSFSEYMIDRFSRIYVLYIPALIISYVVFIMVLGRVPPATWDLVGHLLQLQHTPFARMIEGVPPIKVYGGNSVLWTIAIEWWLYVFFGIAFFWRSMSLTERVFAIALAGPAVLVVGYFTVWESVAWEWFLGAACAAIYVYAPQTNWKQILVPLAAVVVGMLWRFQKLSLASQINMYDLQLMILVGVVLMFVVLASTNLPVVSSVRWVVAKGAYVSYAMYLTHEPIRVLISKYMNVSQMANAWLSIFLCVLFAAACAWLLEDKHLDLRRWLKKKLIAPERELITVQANKLS